MILWQPNRQYGSLRTLTGHLIPGLGDKRGYPL